ncbi:MAG TPA: hypothetical protein PLI09_17435, partial [Candidatus Hydrogenedentes bacterium]|nr:hypothetical protein [Candidatus Hydrogenedentota bacterium]
MAETILSGDDIEGAKALRMATSNEYISYVVGPIVLSRLSECKETLNKNILMDESIQPNWWCHFSDSWWGSCGTRRKDYIFACFADMLREASPSSAKLHIHDSYFHTIEDE